MEEAIGDRDVTAKGKVERLAGKVQTTLGQVEKALEK